ncbi:hypothetical protein TRFO_04871 [Tritrichomonas foetus]|uniref:Intimal thickness related receptor IRP domain-containing protein n=1 Tax=Tritrichomonas foetus TaxID=1144522 RepID=A0A1J4KBJ3_9EUKA|nr:hypothetical protein TRFO_04871 [Tritrichomonas foetus]|eukprot:OHT08272.1 hypothetical protein TRFO_04871 [Tritrichomonas foetus]
MIWILLILTFRGTHNIKSSSSAIKIHDFGFEENSTYEVKISMIKSQNLMFCLFHDSEFNHYTINKLPIETVCDSKSDFPKMKIEILPKNSDNEFTNPLIFNFSGVINKEGIYHQIIVNCEEPEIDQISTILTIQNDFKNPSSLLDSRWKGVFDLKTITMSLSLIIIVFWFIYWIFFPSAKTKLQYSLGVTYIFYCIYQICRLTELKKLDYTDDATLFIVLRVIFYVLYMVSNCCIVFLAAKGWCILHNEISLVDIGIQLFLYFTYLSISIFLQFINLYDFELMAIMISFLALTAFVRELFLSMTSTRLDIASKLLSIMTNGFGSKSTKFYQQRKVYSLFEMTITVIPMFYLLKIFVKFFFTIPFYIEETLFDICSIAFLVTISILFQMISELIRDYSSVDSTTTSRLSELDSLNTSEDEGDLNLNLSSNHETDPEINTSYVG